MFSKSDFDNIDNRLKKITMQPVEQIEIGSNIPPTIDELEDNNKTFVIQPAILFIDIRKSTYLTENSQAKSMVKIYRSFMRMAVDCVRKNGGVTRQFLGDRIMGVFMDSINEEGSITEKAVDKAVNCARSLSTVIDFSLNKYLKNNVNGKLIECGIGIDYGKILVTKVGMYGVELDETREDETDCVWVGNTTNHASKYSDLASGGEVFISKNAYKALSNNLKEADIWKKSAKYKGTKLFEGYVVQDYYLDFVEELENPVKVDNDNTASQDTSFQLAEGILEIERLQKRLIDREKELVLLGDKLQKENSEYEAKYNNECKARMAAERELDSSAKTSYKMVELYYCKLRNILAKVHVDKYSFMDELGGADLCDIIDDLYGFGKCLGKEKEDITIELACYLITVYNYFKMYKEAYDVMVMMASKSSWVCLRRETIQWAKKEDLTWKLWGALDNNIKNSKNQKADWERYMEYFKEMGGY
ncbi:adenylate/guanylate cyclase domain-containing protein [Faecalicatena contorta]|uniref:Adenylate cyclase, class 3 n=1 Tax=Faecalicatena contorta TaxID=39482 RepID=A0A315ZR65_9FIRM|nr:adenylate/guanylate cyclase domain-containing protein [Faecalicatena contorta]PWJ47792.1 class 3 adenylate cyclase [Faecalicatena contorta]SUQ15786.1 Adenylate cyclase, class 3 [Faecalicatena contorta]